jgi:hypothetical protein
MLIGLLVSTLLVQSRVHYDYWMASAKVAPIFSQVATESYDQAKGWVRGLTEKGELFHVGPAGFWSKTGFRMVTTGRFSPSQPYYGATFLLPSGDVTAGGKLWLNGYFGPSDSPIEGGIIHEGVLTDFTDPCFVTAVSPAGRMVGVMRPDSSIVRFQPCRILGGRAKPIKSPSGMPPGTFFPIAATDGGAILASYSAVDQVIPDESVIWMSDGTVWRPAQQFKRLKGVLALTALNDSGLSVGCIVDSVGTGEEERETRHAVKCTKSGVTRLEEPPGATESEATHIMGDTIMGWVQIGNEESNRPTACLWRGGKVTLLSSLLPNIAPWKVGEIGAFNRKGQLAVTFWKSKGVPDRFDHTFGVLTPRP